MSYQPNWLNTDQWHIELRSAERLPVTETGYRSYFVPTDGFADNAEIAACITAWLDTAADTTTWKKYLQDSRQLKLF